MTWSGDGDASINLDDGLFVAKKLAWAGRSVHVPILVPAVVDAFRKAQGTIFLDATLGGGGHSLALLEAFPRAELWAMDADRLAVERARALLPKDRCHIFWENFSNLDRLDQKTFDAVLFDLGLSSDQLESPERGFSFRLDGPLDMRFNGDFGQTAEKFLETASHGDLVRAVRDYGEEPHWRRVVEAIEGARGSGKLGRTTSFSELLRHVLPPNFRSSIDPATRVFQGVRIAVNRELDVLERALPMALAALCPGGVLAVLSFHSLEDRIVKRNFRSWSGLAIDCHDGRYAQDRVAVGRQLTNLPIFPDADEVRRNPRSRSAKLRIFQKNLESGTLR
ncbi:MAG: 16S rRNA (cytosine(1402)-N(4))-methyltransferase RsmH [Puniceicoccales bacterium]|jgi:16S rRNA (cytosine1402-N4)-methyltransferase|nr:16S rRNA (cytosine(1402)-N(4))-methyltransferase RsmH [Puniceicoccales bacterium]